MGTLLGYEYSLRGKEYSLREQKYSLVASDRASKRAVERASDRSSDRASDRAIQRAIERTHSVLFAKKLIGDCTRHGALLSDVAVMSNVEWRVLACRVVEGSAFSMQRQCKVLTATSSVLGMLGAAWNGEFMHPIQMYRPWMKNEAYLTIPEKRCIGSIWWFS